MVEHGAAIGVDCSVGGLPDVGQCGEQVAAEDGGHDLVKGAGLVLVEDSGPRQARISPAASAAAHGVGALDAWIAKLFSPHRIEETIDLMTAAAPPAGRTDHTAAFRAQAVHRGLRCRTRHPPSSPRS
ncbi:hypothetical protein [Streptomyces sp. NPDC006784]|uniref:hypothetical protein n=1 Tax=Streptomyces sp. NPDC006784 TaxID=3364764 RepID=UPI0036D0DB40